MCRRRIVIKEDLVAEDKCSIGELTWAQLSTMVQKRPQSARGQAGVQMERRSSSSWGFSSRRARVFFILQSPPRVFKKRGVGYERSISQSVVSGSPAHPASEDATFSKVTEESIGKWSWRRLWRGIDSGVTSSEGTQKKWVWLGGGSISLCPFVLGPPGLWSLWGREVDLPT